MILVLPRVHTPTLRHAVKALKLFRFYGPVLFLLPGAQECTVLRLRRQRQERPGWRRKADRSWGLAASVRRIRPTAKVGARIDLAKCMQYWAGILKLHAAERRHWQRIPVHQDAGSIVGLLGSLRDKP